MQISFSRITRFSLYTHMRRIGWNNIKIHKLCIRRFKIRWNGYGIANRIRSRHNCWFTSIWPIYLRNTCRNRVCIHTTALRTGLISDSTARFNRSHRIRMSTHIRCIDFNCFCETWIYNRSHCYRCDTRFLYINQTSRIKLRFIFCNARISNFYKKFVIQRDFRGGRKWKW